eukprot:2554089-Alexandrium_andersonii.AAC.1
MSASLVGSEMCIRDRVDRARSSPQTSHEERCARGKGADLFAAERAARVKLVLKYLGPNSSARLAAHRTS